MSLVCPVGPEANLLTKGPEHCARLNVSHPILSLEEMQAVKTSTYRGWKGATVDMTFAVGSGAEGLQEALARICEEASAAIQGGATLGSGSDEATDGCQVIGCGFC